MELSVLDIPLGSHSEDELLELFNGGMLVFHNLDTLYKTHLDAEFRSVCQRAEFSAIDGQVLRGLVTMLGAGGASKVSGSDFLPAFCRHHSGDPEVKLFLLGAGPGVAERARQALNLESGREIVVGAHSPSFHLLADEAESGAVVDLINSSGATVLAVGMGAPKQEIWIDRYRDAMPDVGRFMAVGATLDFEAGRVRRAPRLVSLVGLEWLFRLLQEPRRLWRRYLVQGPRVILALARRGRVKQLSSPPGARAA